MSFSGNHFVTDFHNAYGTFGLGNIIFTFFWRIIREHILQFLCCHKENIRRQNLFNIIILNRHELFCFAKYFIYGTHGFFQCFDIPFFFADDFFPVPLINKNRMNIIRHFIAANSIHVGIQTFPHGKTVFFECKTLPFGKRLHNLSRMGGIIFDIESNRTFNPVQIIIESGRGVYKKRCRNAKQIKACRQQILKKVFYGFDADLCIMQVQCGMIIFWYLKVFHS